MRGREGASFISPDVQRQRIMAHAEAHGHEVVRFHEDLDEPGSRADRPGLLAAMERIERGETEGLVCARLDRFGRSVIDAARNMERIQAAGGVLLTVAEGIDTSGVFGRFLANLMAALAQLELDRIRESWEVARERAVARGVHVASRTPTGYVRGDDGRLEPGPGAEAVRAAFRARAAGASWGELARIMEGTPSPYGQTGWVPRALTHLISNPAYLGEARSGEFVNPDAHPALVDEATWRAAQRPRGVRSRPVGANLLQGLVRCAGCRYVMKPDRTIDRKGERVRTYRCRGRRPQGECPARAAVTAEIVEGWVVERFFERVGELEVAGTEATQQSAESANRLAAARAELAAYRDSAAVSVLGAAEYVAGLRHRQGAVEEAEEAERQARARAGVVELGSGNVERAWGRADTGERNHLLRSAIDAVFVKRIGQGSAPIGERARILWTGEAADLPGPGRRLREIRSFDF